jgi:hypothetical protein
MPGTHAAQQERVQVDGGVMLQDKIPDVCTLRAEVTTNWLDR